MPPEPPSPSSASDKIEAAFRNGSLTLVGLIFGFSLNFVVQWATIPETWVLIDLVAAIPLLIGLALQLVSVAELLRIDSLEVAVYERARRHFLYGLALFGAGVAIIVAGYAIDAGFHTVWTRT